MYYLWYHPRLPTLYPTAYCARFFVTGFVKRRNLYEHLVTDVLYNFIWVQASVSNVLLFNCNDGIFSYPVDDEVLRSCARAVERFEGGEFSLLLRFFDHSY